jgi:hypothetical protein
MNRVLLGWQLVALFAVFVWWRLGRNGQ